MTTFLLALGLVFLLEGLVLALAPSRLEEALRLLQSLPPETVRLRNRVFSQLGAGPPDQSERPPDERPPP